MRGKSDVKIGGKVARWPDSEARARWDECSDRSEPDGLEELVEVGCAETGNLPPTVSIHTLKRERKRRRRTGSQPSMASKPAVSPLHSIELLPDLMSVSALFPVEYSHGFRKPIGGLPCTERRSLMSATMLANTGVDALVP